MITWGTESFKNYLDLINVLVTKFEYYNVLSGAEQEDFGKELNSMFAHLTCPRCARVGTLERFTTYDRFILFFNRSWALQQMLITVPRLKCNKCKSTHAILSVFMVPYRQYVVDAMLLIGCSHESRIALPKKAEKPGKSDRPAILPRSRAVALPAACAKDQFVVVEMSYDACSHVPQPCVYDSYVTESGIEVLSPRADISGLMVPYGLGPQSFFLPNDNGWESRFLFCKISEAGDSDTCLVPVAGVAGSETFVSSALRLCLDMQRQCSSDAFAALALPDASSYIPSLSFSEESCVNPGPFVLCGTSDLQAGLKYAEALDNVICGTSASSGIWLPGCIGDLSAWQKEQSYNGLSLREASAGPSLQEEFYAVFEEAFNRARLNEMSQRSLFAVSGVMLPPDPDMRRLITFKDGEVLFALEPMPQQTYTRNKDSFDTTIVPISTIYSILNTLDHWMPRVDQILRQMDLWDRGKMIGIKEAAPILFSIPPEDFQREIFKYYKRPFLFPEERIREIVYKLPRGRRIVTEFPFTSFAPNPYIPW